MLDFHNWLKRPLAAYGSDEAALDALEDRVQDVDNLRLFYGQLQGRCCRCDQWTESPVGIDELEPIEDYEHYCGGSPRCCP